MKVGVVGLGDIAEKAYLPVIGARRDVVLHLATRNKDALQRIGGRYHIPEEHRHRDVNGLIKAGVEAVFVHTATESHYDIVKALLEHGVHVYVDKPVDYFLERTKQLTVLAEQQRRLLTVGFNRRFAPMYRRLHGEESPDIVLMQKNRVNLARDVRTVILDDFIHVVDTLRFYSSEPLQDVHVQWKRTDAGLAHVVVQLVDQDCTAIGMMNRDSGATEETLELMRPERKWKVNNLREMIEFKAGEEKRIRTGDWTSVGDVRGFTAIVDSFLSAVREVRGGDKPIPAEYQQAMWDALTTHAVCEEIVRRIEANG